jgi:hypothetical protein
MTQEIFCRKCQGRIVNNPNKLQDRFGGGYLCDMCNNKLDILYKKSRAKYGISRSKVNELLYERFIKVNGSQIGWTAKQQEEWSKQHRINMRLMLLMDIRCVRKFLENTK